LKNLPDSPNIRRLKLLEKINSAFRPQKISRTRMLLALAVAVVADGLQILLGPLGWAGLDQAIDFVAMMVTMWLLGFHLLLLPTFFVELIPVIEDLPTWTACVAAVIALRRGEPPAGKNPPTPATAEKPVIEI
jgi:hypothetical protein